MRRAARRWLERSSFPISLVGLLLVLLVGSSLPFTVREVPAGCVGVIWERFNGGTKVNRVLHEGVQIIMPWDRLYIYSARLQQLIENYDTLSKDGLSMVVTISTRYRINPANVGYLHKFVGPQYPSILIGPSIGAVTRAIVSQYSPEDLYSGRRAEIQASISRGLYNEEEHARLDKSATISVEDLVLVTDVLIRRVELPATVRSAIEVKAQQEQLALEYKFRLERETYEATRRKIEAEGLKSYEDAMPKGILPSYLTLMGIEATEALAASPNAKIIMIGGGAKGLPVILNTGDGGVAPAEGGAVPARLGGKLPPAARQSATASTHYANHMASLVHRMNPFSPPYTDPSTAPATAPGASNGSVRSH